jgi:hypothetical protein
MVAVAGVQRPSPAGGYGIEGKNEGMISEDDND